MRFVSSVAALLALLLVAVQPASAEKRLALVIGNSSYSGTAALANPTRDAELVADSLRAGGYAISHYRDLTASEMRAAIDAFIAEVGRAGPEALSVFFYSGHAARVAGENVLIPVDARRSSAANLRQQALRLNDYLRRIGETQATRNVVVLDASRANSFVANGQDTIGLARIDKDLLTKARTYVMFSAGPGRIAVDGEGGASTFSRAFAKHIRVLPRDLQTAFTRARTETASATDNKQVPILWHPRSAPVVEAADSAPPSKSIRPRLRSGDASSTVGETPQPRFPWPPPRASARYVIPRDIVLGDTTNATWGGVEARLVAALDSAGYFDRSVYFVPSGFAIVTRLERIDADGNPLAEDDRWPPVIGATGTFSLASYISRLFFAETGYYRVIAFIAAPRAFVEGREPPTGPEATEWVRSGLNAVPPEARNLHYSDDFTLTALIYEFRHEGGGVGAELLLPGRLPGRAHLERGRIITMLSN